MEGLARILAELHDIAFWIVTVADSTALELPLAFGWVEFAAQASGFHAGDLNALNGEDELDWRIFSAQRRRGHVDGGCQPLWNCHDDELKDGRLQNYVVLLGMSELQAGNLDIERTEASHTLGVEDGTRLLRHGATA